MALLLGIDTGGTYTDAVLFDEEKGIVASAKSLTTRHDYSVGVGHSISKVIEESQVSPTGIGLVSLSTTLATNAVVEGQGGRICLVMIGFDEKALDRNGLREALQGDPVIFLKGGHTGQGEPAFDLDEPTLRAALSDMDGDVSAFAVAGMFAIRNPEHEWRVRDIILEEGGNSVTCSHELSSKLDGPRRALTSVLNARLINLIHHLISATEEKLVPLGIEAPLMVVQGDGALISADLAKLKPIETILSGPAASLVGAAYLGDTENAVVSDIGGTTTDIAFLQDNTPRLDKDGATVGGWRTMVEAVAMYTIGLGGDSEVSLQKNGLELTIILGPRRLIPISLLATTYPELVHKTLEIQALRPRISEIFGRFAILVGRKSAHLSTLNSHEQALIDHLESGPMSLDQLLAKRRDHMALDRLVSAGLVQVAGLTPSDAAHILDMHSAWDKAAAIKAAELYARQKDARGLHIAKNAQELAKQIVDRLTAQSSSILLEAALDNDIHTPPELAKKMLAARDNTNPFVDVDVKFRLPIIGLGASAHIYYPDVARRLKTLAVIPDHADVANAVGAVVGQVRCVAEATISQAENDCYRLYGPKKPEDFSTLELAVEKAETLLTETAKEKARAAGAVDIQITFERIDKTAMIEGRELFVESQLKATAFGRPRIAR
jgi:N-methylhydantoinase A/oxoprolinase/acetone carboxylase beta subunit